MPTSRLSARRGAGVRARAAGVVFAKPQARRSTTPTAAKQSGGTEYADKGPSVAQGSDSSSSRVRLARCHFNFAQPMTFQPCRDILNFVFFRLHALAWLSHKRIYDKVFQVILKSSRQRLSKTRYQGARSQFSSRKIVGRLLAAAVITCLAGAQNMDQGSLCEGIQGYKSGHKHKGPEGGPAAARKTLSISVNWGQFVSIR